MAGQEPVSLGRSGRPGARVVREEWRVRGPVSLGRSGRSGARVFRGEWWARSPCSPRIPLGPRVSGSDGGHAGVHQATPGSYTNPSSRAPTVTRPHVWANCKSCGLGWGRGGVPISALSHVGIDLYMSECLG